MSAAARLWPGATLFVVGLGAALRIGHFVSNRSLWRDEAALAVSIVEKSYAALSGPLFYGQEAPLAFLWLQKLVTTLFGSSELALRAAPLLASLAALVLLAWVARRLLPPRAAALALAAFALSPPLVYYAAEAKQYAFDVLAAALALWAYTLGDSMRVRVGLALGGAVLVWFSHPAAFVLAGLGLAAVVSASRAQLLRLLPVVGAWLASFAVFFALSLARVAESPIMQSAWGKHFWPLPPTSAAELAWLPLHAGGVFRATLGVHPLMALPAATLAVTGLVAAWRAGSRGLVVLLVVPPLAALAASALRLYPFTDRLLLYLAPLVVVALGLGVQHLPRFVARSPALVALALAVTAGAQLVELARAYPFAREEVRGLLTALEGRVRAGDVVLVHPSAEKVVRYYRRLRPEVLADAEVVMPAPDPAAAARVADSKRVFVLAAPPPGTPPAFTSELLAAMDQAAQRRAITEAPGALLAEYELASPRAAE